jgi:hypothetical protein
MSLRSRTLPSSQTQSQKRGKKEEKKSKETKNSQEAKNSQEEKNSKEDKESKEELNRTIILPIKNMNFFWMSVSYSLKTGKKDVNSFAFWFGEKKISLAAEELEPKFRALDRRREERGREDEINVEEVRQGPTSRAKGKQRERDWYQW